MHQPIPALSKHLKVFCEKANKVSWVDTRTLVKCLKIKLNIPGEELYGPNVRVFR